MAQTNRWHPVMLPDDYLRKMKEDLSEVEAQVEAETRCEPDLGRPSAARRRPTARRFDIPAR